MVKPIIINNEPIFSFNEGIAWIDGTPIKLGVDKIADFTVIKAKSFEETKDELPPKLIESTQHKQGVDVYLSDDEDVKPPPVVKQVARPPVARPPVVAKQVARPPVAKPPVVAKQVAKPAVMPVLKAPEAAAKPLTDEQKENMFWEQIDSLGWRNKSDMIFDINRARKMNANINDFHRRVDLMSAIIADNEAYSALELENRQKLTYHIVLLGRGWFENILNSPDLVTYLILTEEVQEFNIADVEKLFT